MTLRYNHTRYACYIGYITQAIIVNLLPLLFIILQSDFGIAYDQLGGLILLNFVTQLIVDVLAAKFVDKIGYRIPVVGAHLCVVVGLCLLAAAPLLPMPIYGALAMAVIIYAVGGGLLEVLVSPIVDALPAPEEEKGAGMALLHSFYSWGQVAVVAVTTLLLLALGNRRWQALPLIWALVPLFNGLFFTRVPLMPTIAEENRIPLRKMLRMPAFIAALVLMMCAGASEQTVSQWASLFAEQGLGLSKVWGDLAGPCLFAVLMGIGRIIYGIWGAKIKMQRYMALLGLLAVACYLTIVFSPHPALSLVACALCGFAVSIMWPGTLSLCSARFPMGGTAMFALLAMFGDVGCSLGPWLAGIIAESATAADGALSTLGNTLFSGGGIELKMGILVGTIFPIIMLLALPAFRGKKQNSE